MSTSFIHVTCASMVRYVAEAKPFRTLNLTSIGCNSIEWKRTICHVNGYNVQGTIIVRGINDGNRTENNIPFYFRRLYFFNYFVKKEYKRRKCDGILYSVLIPSFIPVTMIVPCTFYPFTWQIVRFHSILLHSCIQLMSCLEYGTVLPLRHIEPPKHK